AHLSGVTDPLGRQTTFGFDAVGNRLNKADPGGNCGATPVACTRWGYDAANQLTSITFSDGVTPNVSSIHYDADGRRKDMTDGTGTTRWSWDSLGRLTSSTNGAGQAIGYGYDLKGQLTSITYPGGPGQVLTRHFDNAGNLDYVQDWAGHRTTFGLDPDNNVTTLTFPPPNPPTR